MSLPVNNTYTMDNKPTKKPSLFDNLLNETDDDEDVEYTVDDVFKLNKTDLQCTTALNESSNCNDMVRRSAYEILIRVDKILKLIDCCMYKLINHLLICLCYL